MEPEYAIRLIAEHTKRYGLSVTSRILGVSRFGIGAVIAGAAKDSTTARAVERAPLLVIQLTPSP
jgi:hypothetical protein